MSEVSAKPSFGPINRLNHWAKSHRNHFGVASPVFPKTLGRERRATLDQLASELCTAYGEAVSNGYEQDRDFSGEFQAAAEGQYLGAPIVDGADPYPSMQATSVVGSLPSVLSPFTLSDKGDAFIADWKNWPTQLFAAARAFKSPLIPYYVDGPYDVFDNIRNALYQAQKSGEKGVVKAFGFWYQSWNQQAVQNRGRLECPAASESPISRHRYTFIDFDTDAHGEPVLVAALTQGSSYGDNGFCYFDRATVDQVFKDAIMNGVGLYINRPPKDGIAAAIAWFSSILSYLSARVNLLIQHQH